IRAGDEVGASTLDELVIEAPLVLPERDTLHLHVAVGAPDGTGARPVTIHSRPAPASADRTSQAAPAAVDGAWTRHASGLLSADRPDPAAPTGWAPADGAEHLAPEEAYELLAAVGLDYGPAFRGLREVWRDGATLHAHAVLPEQLANDAARFGLHPALLDAAAQLPALDGADRDPADGDPAAARTRRLPFAYRGVTLHAAAATELRVLVTATGSDSYRLEATDPAGRPVITVESLVTRPVPAEGVGAGPAVGRDTLFAVDWPEVALAAAPAAPDNVLRVDGDVVATLAALQSWLAQDDGAGAPLLVLTRLAVAVDESETPDLTAAPVWGLVRSAQSENPGRIVLVDTDGTEASEAVLAAAVAGG
ncbi:polyketide synthase dehydratase domain-containing protein, partial [Kitasatospora purpeofusca]